MSSTTDRPWPRRLWGGIGAVLTAVVLAACVHPSLVGILQMTWLADGRESEQVQRTLGDPQDTIWYSGEALQMTFSGEDRDGMELTENLHRTPGAPFTEVTQLDGATAVTTRCAPDCGTLVDQELQVPRETDLSVVSAEGMYYTVQHLEGDLDLWLTGGDLAEVTLVGEPDYVAGHVMLFGIQGDVEVRTLQSGVYAEGLGGQDVAVQTGAGSVDLTHTSVPEDLEVSTGRGDISITLPAQEDPWRCTVETEASGEVDVDLGEGTDDREDDAEAPCRIALRTGDGDITVSSARPQPWQQD
ncbi:DUF4097 family beta strand repeat-containing protein [Nesterenkonia xinjiangensis]|uniref:Adhesin n=1 Tax=Nesterenkonia xinjiangensis TaxID=225327 RepID=A0A7Z0GN04_9MICC|nr:DUF4097 family beta strand repeat-containing protein [Nesterenkonia xinjiangensis]NYJ78713.1 hypothetical protein [Nesterenkonia xinjiangensis]